MRARIKNLFERSVDRLPAAVVRAARRNLHPALRSRVRRALGTADSSPRLSVIVPVYNVEQYLNKCLNSIVNQTYKNLEIIVVDDESPDGSLAIAQQYAKYDNRISIVRKRNGGLGAARNTGMRHATAPYLTFADSDDYLTSDAYELLMGSLLSSGSDMAVGGLYRLKGKRSWVPGWARDIHDRDRRAITIAQLPELFEDVTAWNKIWKREFFDSAVGAWPENIKYEDQEPSARWYLAATAIDVIAEPVYYWRQRDDGTSITQGKAEYHDLHDRTTMAMRAADYIVDHATPEVADQWFRKAFDFDLIQYMQQVPRTDQQYWDRLRSTARHLAELGGTSFWEYVSTRTRLCAWALIDDDRDALMRALDFKTDHGSGYVLSAPDSAKRGVEIGQDRDVTGLHAHSPYLAEISPNIPDELMEVTASTVKLHTGVTGLTWVDGRHLRVTGYAHFLDTSETGPGPISAALVDVVGGARIALTTEPATVVRGYRADTEVRDTTADGFSFDVDVFDLPASATADTSQWRLELTRGLLGNIYTGIVRVCEPDAAAALLGTSDWVDAAERMVLTFDTENGLSLERRHYRVLATEVRLIDRTLELVMRPSPGDVAVQHIHVFNRTTRQSALAKPTRSPDGSLRFSLQIPPLPKNYAHSPDRFNWNLRAIDSNGKPHRIGHPAGTHLRISDGDHRSLHVNGTPRGHVQVREIPVRGVATDITTDTPSAESPTITFSGRLSFPRDRVRPQFRLDSGAAQLEPTSARYEAGTGSFVVEFSLTRSSWGYEGNGIPRGNYRLQFSTVPNDARSDRDEVPPRARAASSQWVPVELSDSLVPRLPIVYETGAAAVTITRTSHRDNVWFKVQPPMAGRNRGKFARRAAIESAIAQNASDGLLDAVLFETFRGASAGDSGRAIYEDLRGRYPELACYWSIAHTDVRPPAGTIPVLVNSPEYLRILHRARLLVNNGDFLPYFRKQPGQFYLQTWHGTPLKKIAGDITENSLSLSYRLRMVREAAYWDLLLAQNEFAAGVFPGAFGYRGYTAVTGYPRNDRLALGTTNRHEVLNRLGIPTSARVLMIAPTFRDAIRTSDGKYALVVDLDVEALLDALPHDVHVVLRGHSNAARSTRYANIDRLVDASDYPDITDLMAVADVLVTDYSSLMFDFCVTGRPIILHAPDLDEYVSESRELYLDYTETAPGPITRSDDELRRAVMTAFAGPAAPEERERYRLFVNRFAPLDDGRAAQRVVDRLLSVGAVPGAESSHEALGA